MNKLLFLAPLFLGIASSEASFEAPSQIPFMDFFQSYSKRNNFISNHIVKILDGKDKNTSWKCCGHGYPDEVQVDFDFYHTDEKSLGDWTENFTYSEVKLGEKIDIKNFDELVERVKNNTKFPRGEENLILNERGRVIIEFCRTGTPYNRRERNQALKEIRKVGDTDYQILSLYVKDYPLSKEEINTWVGTFNQIKIRPESK